MVRNSFTYYMYLSTDLHGQSAEACVFHANPAPSEGGGHRFEFCRVRQFTQ